MIQGLEYNSIGLNFCGSRSFRPKERAAHGGVCRYQVDQRLSEEFFLVVIQAAAQEFFVQKSKFIFQIAFLQFIKSYKFQ